MLPTKENHKESVFLERAQWNTTLNKGLTYPNILRGEIPLELSKNQKIFFCSNQLKNYSKI